MFKERISEDILNLGKDLNTHDHEPTRFNITSIQNIFFKTHYRDFPGGAVVKNLPANAGDTGSSPGPGRSHRPRSN